jgi:hypothetical protein
MLMEFDNLCLGTPCVTQSEPYSSLSKHFSDLAALLYI